MFKLRDSLFYNSILNSNKRIHIRVLLKKKPERVCINGCLGNNVNILYAINEL